MCFTQSIFHPTKGSYLTQRAATSKSLVGPEKKKKATNLSWAKTHQTSRVMFSKEMISYENTGHRRRIEMYPWHGET